MPRQASRDGTSGVVSARVLIHDGRVVNVEIVSGPRVFHTAVREAMLRYKCVSSVSDIVATQSFDFKNE